MLGSVQGGPDKRAGQGTKESRQVCSSHEQSDMGTLASRRKIARLCALYKAYRGEKAWKAIGDRMERPHYLSRVDHNQKISNRRQRTDTGKYSYVNKNIEHWNQLHAEI